MKKNFLPDILDRPLRQFPNLVPHLFSDAWSNLFDEDSPHTSNKGIRMYEEANHLLVELPLAGLKASEIELDINDNILNVTGESREQEGKGDEKKSSCSSQSCCKEKKVYRSCKRKYSYSIALPTKIDESANIDATFTDGILKVSIPVATKSSKKITVKEGSGK